MRTPRVSVIVPTYHDWTRLATCLAHLREQTCRTDEFEVIVVNNDPADPCPVADLGPNTVVINEAKPGSYAARNRGVEHSNGEIVMFTDSDCVPDRSWVGECLAGFDSNQRIQRLAGRVALFTRHRKPNLAESYELVYAFQQERRALLLGAAATANMAARRCVFEKIGLFSEDMYSGGDIEWGVRASRRGIGITYRSSMVVGHPARVSLKQLIEKRQRVTAGMSPSSIRRSCFASNGLVTATVRDIVPPVRSINRGLRTPGLSVWTRVEAIAVMWSLRLYRAFYRLVLAVGLSRPRR